MLKNEAKDFVVVRGGAEDTRPLNEKPYSAASYSAQYGIPVEDAQRFVDNYHTHGEVRERIYREFLSDSKAREAALKHRTRPHEPQTKKTPFTGPIEGPLTDPEFERPATILGGILGAGGMDYQRKFFGCEDFSNEDLDEWADWLQGMPGGEWLQEHSADVRRVYAMSCISLQRKDSLKFKSLIVDGKMWDTYGPEEA